MYLKVKVDEFIEMVSTTVETYAQLFTDGDMTTFSSDDEAHFVLALSGVITSNDIHTPRPYLRGGLRVYPPPPPKL